MTSLSGFSYDWVGGNIRGLQAFDEECRTVASRINDVDHTLARQVPSVVSAGGWTGKAADSFARAWERDSRAGAQLAEAWQKIGEIAVILAAELATLESSLEEAAYELEKQGIAVNTATGILAVDVMSSGHACPDPHMAAVRGRLADDYMAYRAQILNRATEARTHAAYGLYSVIAEILPPATDWGQLINDLDGVRGLWATPTIYQRELMGDFSKAEVARADAINEQWKATIAGRKVSGDNFRMEKDLVDKANEARQEVAGLEGKLVGSPPESKISMAAAGDSEGLGLLGAAGKVVKGVPYAGAAAGTVIQVVQDSQNHESWRHSLVDGIASSGAALGTGVAVAGIIGSGSVGAVATGIVVGGAFAVGVGDFTHNVVQENWPADWKHHGVLDGTAHGVADSYDKTRHDMAHYGDDIINFFS